MFNRYDDETGYEMLQFDLTVAAEINDRIKEQTEEVSAKRAVAKRNQKRASMASSGNVGEMMDKWVAGE